MSRTFIEYREQKGFWIEEDFVELLSYYLCLAFEKKDISKMTAGAQEIYDNCKDNSSGGNTGMVHILFGEYIRTKEEREEMLGILSDAKGIIEDQGEEIDVKALNHFESMKASDEFKSPWKIAVKTASLIATIGILEKMLKDQWEEDNYGVWFKGYPHPKGTKVI